MRHSTGHDFRNHADNAKRSIETLLLRPGIRGLNTYAYSEASPILAFDPFGLDVYYAGIGFTSYVGKENRRPGPGKVRAVSVGIAYEEQTRSFRLFKSTGPARPGDTSTQVGGFNLGFVGPVQGGVRGCFEDFFGRASENSFNLLGGSVTFIETESGTQGFGSAILGKGFGVGTLSITTETTPLFSE